VWEAQQRIGKKSDDSNCGYDRKLAAPISPSNRKYDGKIAISGTKYDRINVLHKPYKKSMIGSGKAELIILFLYVFRQSNKVVAIQIDLNKFSHVSIFAKNSPTSKTSLSASKASRIGEPFGNFSNTKAFSGRMSILNLARSPCFGSFGKQHLLPDSFLIVFPNRKLETPQF
jgi:hypothetical protein